jgi:regulator of RNase E activity RraA
MTDTPKAWPPGYAVNPRHPGPSAEFVEAFRTVPVAHASDSMGRCTGSIGLNAYHHDVNLTMCGPAFTVRVRPGDNLMIHVALSQAQPGDVIVIDGAGDLTQALIGGLMRTTLMARKLGGIVVDGALRDLAEWAEGGMPVYARGHTHRGPSKDGPGEVNIPIACAGMAVMPGDLILGDADGVVTIPSAAVADLLPKVRAHAAKEEKIRAGNRSGASDPERFNAMLREKGCPV